MTLTLEASKLLSRVIRKNASNGITGAALISPAVAGPLTLKPRKIANLFQFKNEEDSGGILQKIWDAGKSFVGWIGGIVKGFAFSASAIWTWLIGRIEQLKSFDWNATDAAYNQLMQNQNTRIASLWGGVLGKGLGWLAGIGVGAGVGFLCPAIGGATLAKTIALAGTKEALEEFLPSFRNALIQTAGEFANRALLVGYMNYRNWLKRAPRALLVSIYGNDGADFIQNVWGAKGGPNMSFNSQMDDFVESISNNTVQAFVEELLDESWDSFTEAGFIIAREIDDALQQYRAGEKTTNGTPRTIYLKPDKDGDEIITFSRVPQQLLQVEAQQIINHHRLINNRDLGEIIGQPASNLGRAMPQLRQLVIVFRSRPRPPWRHDNGKRCQQASYTIPNAKLGLTWEQIKNAADPYNWGEWRATAHLDDRRQMAVYGATPQDAEVKLRKLLTLSTSQMVSFSITQEKDRPEKLKKRPTMLYPAFATMLARKQSLDGQGRVTLNNATLDEKYHRFPLWGKTEPKDMPPLN